MTEELVQTDSDLVTIKQLAEECKAVPSTIQRQIVTYGVVAKRESSGHGITKFPALYSRAEFFSKKNLYMQQQQQQMHLKKLDKKSNEIIDTKPELALVTTLNTLDQLDSKILTDPEEYLYLLDRVEQGIFEKRRNVALKYLSENKLLKLDLQETKLQLQEAQEECEQLEDNLINVKDCGQFYTILRWCNEFRGEGVVKKKAREELSINCARYYESFGVERRRVGENSQGIFERWAYPPEFISKIATILHI